MKLRLEFHKNTLVVAFAAFVGGVIAMTGYTLVLLRADAVSRGVEISAMHTQSTEDLLTQTLHNIKLIAASVLIQTPDELDPSHIIHSFSAALNNSPSLRSMSMLDERDRVTISSNDANIGMVVLTNDFLPPDIGEDDVLRIGAPWEGRDFSSGQAASRLKPVQPEMLSFIPITQTLVSNHRKITLLLALNTDYFINRISQQLEVDKGTIDVFLYDGTVLISSDPAKRQGEKYSKFIGDLKLSEKESGQFEEITPFGRKALTTYRSSRLYPFVVVTRLDFGNALQNWGNQAKVLVSIVALALFFISTLAYAYYRRQLQMAEQKAEADRLYRINATVFDSSNEAILIADEESRVISINHAFSVDSGYAENEVKGRFLQEFLTEESASVFSSYVYSCQMTNEPGTQPRCGVTEGEIVCKNGQTLWAEILSTPEYDPTGSFVGFHRICRNISERKRMENEVRQLAFYDPLTNLPNRRLFDDRFSQVLVACKRNSFYGALIFLDLDNFKPLNDTYGHAVGDLLLIEAAHRIKACVREVDTVARFGGDEFVVLLAALGSNQYEANTQAEIIAKKIHVSLCDTYRLVTQLGDGHETIVEHRCTASIGVALFSGNGEAADEILKCADAAMYQVKNFGRNQIRFYEGELEVSKA